MSRPDDFDRLDRAGDHPPDRFRKFQADTKAALEYREAFRRAEAADPGAVAGLPDPDGNEPFDPAEALARLRGAPQTLRADPPREVRG